MNMSSVEAPQFSPETAESEMTNEERIRQLESKVDGLTEAVALLMEDRKQLQRIRTLNEDPTPQEQMIEQAWKDKHNVEAPGQ